MQVKFRREILTLVLGHYFNGKAKIEESVTAQGYVLGDNPLVGYCPTFRDQSNLPWTVVHIKTGFSILCCKSEKRARAMVRAIEEKHRDIFTFDKVPSAKKLTKHKDTVAYLKTIAQGEWKE